MLRTRILYGVAFLGASLFHIFNTHYIAYFIWLLYVSPPDAADRFAVFPPEKEEPPQAPAPSDGEAPPQHPADAGEGSDGTPPAR